jgi:hypothetical protein
MPEAHRATILTLPMVRDKSDCRRRGLTRNSGGYALLWHLLLARSYSVV